MKPNPRLHLQAALFAVVIAAATLASGLAWCRHLEKRYVHELSSDFSDAKLQGMALQDEAFAQDDLLVLYGSSELAKEIPNKPDAFFQDYPTGFRVFPVGKAGATSLTVLQKIAAVGPRLRGKKVALSLSPSSYLAATVDPGWYAGSFSEMQAAALAFSPVLSREIKRDAARRMIAYPGTLEDNWLLREALHRLASDEPLDHAILSALAPLGRLQNWISRAQDHFQAAGRIVEERTRLAESRGARRLLNWDDLYKKADRIAHAMRAAGTGRPAIAKRPHGSRDAEFLKTLAHADEWTDLELVLRTLRELGAKPLIVSMPLHAADLEALGVSSRARSAYGERLQTLTKRYRSPLVYLRREENDPAFFYDNLDHPGAKGWIVMNRTLDDFFHDRLPKL